MWPERTHIHQHDHWLVCLLEMFRVLVSAIRGDARERERGSDDNCNVDDGGISSEENVTEKKLFLALFVLQLHVQSVFINLLY